MSPGGRGGGGAAYQIETFDEHTGLLCITNDLRDDALLTFIFSSQNLHAVSPQNVPFVPGKHGLERLPDDPHGRRPGMSPEYCDWQSFASRPRTHGCDGLLLPYESVLELGAVYLSSRKRSRCGSKSSD